MVAYSFKAQFRAPILAGTKCQTIRADRKRHARTGEALQLYTGMRTKQCRLIGRATTISVLPIRLDFRRHSVMIGGPSYHTASELDCFAQSDGFADWQEMAAFWRREHDTLTEFSGMLIRWGDTLKQEPANG